MTDHSPGPWWENIDEQGDVWVMMDSEHSVYIGNMEDTCGECHANSQLITAAPDLLAALKEIDEIAGKVPFDVGSISYLLEQLMHCREVARVAITKAQGED